MNDASSVETNLNFFGLVAARSSVRAFKSTPVPISIIEKCVKCAGLAPSNCNSQPWSIEIVSGNTLVRLKAAMVEAARTMRLAPDIPWLEKLYSEQLAARQTDHLNIIQAALNIKREDKAARQKLLFQNLECFGAPHLALLYMPALGNEREAADVGHFGQTFMLALTESGISSIPQTSIAMASHVIRATLNLDYSRKLLYGISFGYQQPSLPASRIVQGRVEPREFSRYYD